MLLQDIIDYTNMKDKKVAIIFLDQQITSLELNMSGLNKTKFGFGELFRGCVGVLFKNSKSASKRTDLFPVLQP